MIPLRYGKWVPTTGAIGQIVLLLFFTGTVVVYGAQHGVHGIAAAGFAPSYGTFIAIAPVLLYSFIGVELPSTAAEEMVDPRRDIPAAIASAGVCQTLMYAIPILAVLFVLPAEAVTSLHGLIDAMGTVFTVFGGSVGPDGGATLTGVGAVVGAAGAMLFVWVLLASGSAWIMGAGRAQAAACLDGAGPPVLGGSPRAAACRWSWGSCPAACRCSRVVAGLALTSGDGRILLRRADGGDRADRARIPADLPGLRRAADPAARAGAAVPRTRRDGGGAADLRVHRLVGARRALPAVAGVRRRGSGRVAAGGLCGRATGVRVAGARSADRGRRRVGRVLPFPRSRPRRAAVSGSRCGTVGESRSPGSDQVPSLERGSERADHG